MKRPVDLNSYNEVPRKGISWPAIFGGVVCIVSVLLLLNLLGIAFGFGSIDPAQEKNPLSGIGTGSWIWWVVSNIIALFAGGYVAGRVGNTFHNKSGMIQGMLTWALYTFLSAWLLTSAVGSLISGVGNAVGNLFSEGQEQQQQQAQQAIERAGQQQNEQLQISLEEAKQRIYGLLEDTDKAALDPDNIENNVEDVTDDVQVSLGQGSVDQEIEQIFNEAQNEFENTFQALDRQALVNVVTSRTDIPQAEAERAIDNYLGEYENLRQESEEFLQNVEQQAAQTAGNVSEALADAALWTFIALVVGVIVAAFGGMAGVKSLRKDYEKTDYFDREKAVGYGERREK